jgi:putative DNA primase/helicase
MSEKLPNGHQERLELLATARQRLHDVGELPEVLWGRGLSLQECLELELGLDEQGNVIIPIRDLKGELLGLKGRYLKPDKRKYFEIPEDNKNPPWLAPNLTGANKGLLFIEGEFNAMLSWLVLQNEGYGVVGLGSVFAEVPDWSVKANLPWFIYFDNDVVAHKSIQTWLKTAQVANIPARHLNSLQGSIDACEYAERYGQEALKTRWLQLLK